MGLSWVTCYGCGDAYQVTPENSRRHCTHTGDVGLPREQIMEWLDACQAERDEWVRLADQERQLREGRPG